MFTCRRCSVWKETRFTKACDAIRHLLEHHPVKLETFLCDQLLVADVERLLLDDQRDKGGVKKTFHVALSVDVDRHDDDVLAKTICPQATLKDGGHPTPAQLREEIATLRAKGFEVFPPCLHVDSRGLCRGHES